MSRYDAFTPRFLVVAIALSIADLLAVLLRFLARLRSKTRFGLDDLFAVVSLTAYWAYAGMTIWSV